MARVLAPQQAEALFDFDPDGRMFIPDDGVTEAQDTYDSALEVSDQPEQPEQRDDDLEGLSILDRAILNVAPDSINIAERAGHLLQALDGVGSRNKANGYGRALESSEHRNRLVNQAGHAGRAADIASGMQYNTKTAIRAARREFFAASGLASLALRDVVSLSPDELTVLDHVNDDWLGFMAEYGQSGDDGKRGRATLRRQLRRQIPKNPGE